jgi:hypothetical protein
MALTCNLLVQRFASSGHPARHGIDRNVENFRRFVVVHLVHADKNQHCALMFRKIRQCTTHGRLRDVARRNGLSEVAGHLAGSAHSFPRPILQAAVLGNRRRPHDRIHPRDDLCVSAEWGSARHRPIVSRLHKILRVDRRSRERHCEGSQPW